MPVKRNEGAREHCRVRSPADCCGALQLLWAYNQGPVALTAAKLRERLRRIFLGTVVFVLGTAILTFGVDFGVFRLRVAAQRNPYGTVVVSHSYAVQQKNGKTQFIFDPPAPETCVKALFPHSGMLPCWYLSRHPEQRTDI